MGIVMGWLDIILLGAAAAVVFLITLSVGVVLFALPRPRDFGHFGLRRDR
ncbi:hypothetical protein MIC97_16615 [Aquamicrobium sp. NLF2-7]|nr:hypothetical protein [Aquamicrobium sp. NLF2-7]MCG8273123.1 hypothetical protein [Aquamicrobium sp. NLF2-7]